MNSLDVFSPILDGFLGLIFFLEFIGITLITVSVLFVLVTLIEAFVLWWGFNYGSFGRSLLVSLVMNITSTVLGFCAGFFLLSGLQEASISIGQTTNFNVVIRFILLVLMPFILSWVLSVVSEGGILWLMSRNVTSSRVRDISLVANLISYLFLGSVIPVGWLIFNLWSQN